MTTPARRPGFAAFKPFDGRHVAPTLPAAAAPTPVQPEPPVHAAPEATTVARPLRLAAAVDEKLRQLATARGDVSLNAVISLAISEEWARVFRPSTEMVAEQVSALVGAAMAANRHPKDTNWIPDTTRKRSARTLRLTHEIDRKLGELAAHYGGLDRNSTIAIIIASTWRRVCGGSLPVQDDVR